MQHHSIALRIVAHRTTGLPAMLLHDVWWLIATVAALAHILGMLSAIHAIAQVRTPQGAIAWAISLASFPYLALPLYWIFGRNRFHGYVEVLRHASLQQAAQVWLPPLLAACVLLALGAVLPEAGARAHELVWNQTGNRHLRVRCRLPLAAHVRMRGRHGLLLLLSEYIRVEAVTPYLEGVHQHLDQWWAARVMAAHQGSADQAWCWAVAWWFRQGGLQRGVPAALNPELTYWQKWLQR
jgi:hypothetical protein